MPHPTSVVPAAPGAVSRIAGLTLVAIGGAGLVVAAFLRWFTVTTTVPPLPAPLGGVPSEIRAEITGTGAITMASIGGRDMSSLVPTHAAWTGWSVIGCGALAIALAAFAAFGPGPSRRIAAALAGACGLAAAGVAAYALVVPVGSQTVRAVGLDLEARTAAGIGPYVVIASATVLLIGAVALLTARRSAIPASVPVSGPPFAPAPSAPAMAPRPPAPHQAPPNWQPAPSDSHTVQVNTRPKSSNQGPPEHLVTAISPVAQRRPQPEWDRNWPGAAPTPQQPASRQPAPPQPAPRPPAVPSEQHTAVVKRPPRPVRVSPNPETEVMPRQREPNRFDSPTEPL